MISSLIDFIKHTRCAIDVYKWKYNTIRKSRRLHHKFPNNYTDANPLNFINIDPCEIKYVQLSLNETDTIYSKYLDKRNRFDKYKNLGRVFDGDWDEKKGYIENVSDTYNLLYERFENNKEWLDIEVFNKYSIQIQNGKPIWHGCSTLNDLYKRALKVDNLYKSIKDNGYQRRHKADKLNRYHYLDEVTVNIDRFGNLLHNNSGTHRMTIAKIIGLKKIPIRVLVRHKQWQDIRTEILNTKNLEDCSKKAKLFLHHPDLNVLVQKKLRRNA